MRITHPNLWKVYMATALFAFFEGMNFLFSNPAFDPLGIPKWQPGVISTFLGTCSLIVLNIDIITYFPLRLLHRPTLFNGVANVFARGLFALTTAAILAWAGILTKAFFDENQTSLQLPIAYLFAVLVGLALLPEPDVNPVTNKNGVNGKYG
jgi:hypothetical protein